MRTRSFLARRLFGETISAVSALAALVLVAGCSSGTGGAALTSAAAPEKADITVAAIPAVDLAGLYIAQDRGLFTRQGLHVTIVPVPSSQSVISQQLAGQVDISAGSYVAYLAAQAKGARFRILAEASTLSPDTRALVVTRAIEQGQAIANSDISAVQAIMARHDNLPPEVTGSMAMPSSYPVGPVVAADIQRVAAAMLKFGLTAVLLPEPLDLHDVPALEQVGGGRRDHVGDLARVVAYRVHVQEHPGGQVHEPAAHVVGDVLMELLDRVADDLRLVHPGAFLRFWGRRPPL
jgi:ABC-type nitrate/sulfonate/bicarbonate transport system substrate-binding protein